jgi:hypothetical protein
MKEGKISEYLLRKTTLRKLATIEGFLSFKEAHALYRIAKSLSSGSKVVEIGSWKGKSTYCIAKGLSHGSKIYAIDPFNAIGDAEAQVIYEKQKGAQPLIDQFWNNMASCGVTDKIIPCIGYAEEYKDFITQASFIFIDGDHSIPGCEKDFLMYQDKLSNEKIIAFHDYYPERDDLGPTYVIKKYLLNSKNWEKVDIADSLAIFKRIN